MRTAAHANHDATDGESQADNRADHARTDAPADDARTDAPADHARTDAPADDGRADARTDDSAADLLAELCAFAKPAADDTLADSEPVSESHAYADVVSDSFADSYSIGRTDGRSHEIALSPAVPETHDIPNA